MTAQIKSRKESDDDYFAVVAKVNHRWRVIVCRDGIQWILQRRRSTQTCTHSDWRGRSYCTTRKALMRCVSAFAGEIDSLAYETLAGLPERLVRRHWKIVGKGGHNGE